MKYQVKLNSIEDADEYFLVAKDRLLDVNEWNSILTDNYNTFALTNAQGQKLHRDAHCGDMIKASIELNNTRKDRWLHIDKIQYDSYPDINAEEISMNLQLSYSPSGNGVDLSKYKEEDRYLTVVINRTQALVTIKNTATAKDTLFDIPTKNIDQLLKGILTISEYSA
ncbi:MAG: hypothetical protein R2800_04215 [Flavipsychrobacter sp.]